MRIILPGFTGVYGPKKITFREEFLEGLGAIRDLWGNPR